MFTWIKNFFSSFFGTKETAEIAVKAIAASAFRSRPRLAGKVHISMQRVTSSLSLIEVANIDAFTRLLKSEMAKHIMTSEEELALGLLLNNLTAQFPKLSAKSGLSIPAQVSQYAAWISETAAIYSRVI